MHYLNILAFDFHFKIIVPEDIGELYKVRVGFHGDRGEVPWYQNYSLAPSWFLDSVSTTLECVSKVTKEWFHEIRNADWLLYSS